MSDEIKQVWMARARGIEWETIDVFRNRVLWKLQDKSYAQQQAVARELQRVAEEHAYDPVCHCGVELSKHSVYDNHPFTEMETPESMEALVTKLRAQLAAQSDSADRWMEKASNLQAQLAAQETAHAEALRQQAERIADRLRGLYPMPRYRTSGLSRALVESAAKEK